MTKRRTTYGGQLPRTSDGMQPQRNTMVSMARLVEDLLLGQSDPADVTYPILVAGFQPSYAGNMTVDFTAGRVYERDDVDTVAWGGLGTDTRQIYHQGEAEASTLTFAAAPGTVGHSRIDLVQVIRAEVDENGAVLGYYNSAKPSEPLNGPANSGTSQYQDRTQKATLAIKQGTAGSSPTAPTADAGYTALYTVTIPYGETSLDASNVALVVNAPFIAGHLASHHTGVAGAAPKIDYTTEIQNLPVIDVRSYGAVGDGTTDDTAAINAAITAAQAGGVIDFGNLRCAITAQIAITKRLHLVGHGNAAIVEKTAVTATGSGGALVKFTGSDCNQSSVLGLGCEGLETLSTFNANAGADNKEFCFLRFESCDAVVVENVHVTGKRIGVIVDTCTNARVDGLVFYGVLSAAASGGAAGTDNYSNAVKVKGGAKVLVSGLTAKNTGSGVLAGVNGSSIDPSRVTVVNAHIENAWDNGIYFASAQDSTITGCTVLTSNGSGIKARGSRNIVSYNQVTSCLVGIGVSGAGSSPDAYDATGHGCIIQGNRIEDIDRDGINIDTISGYQCRNLQITGNYFRNIATEATTYAAIRGDGDYHQITGNMFEDINAQFAVLLAGDGANLVTGCDVSHNQFLDVDGDAIRLQRVTKSIVSHNMFNDVTGDGVDLRDSTDNDITGNKVVASLGGNGVSATSANSNTGNRIIHCDGPFDVDYQNNTVDNGHGGYLAWGTAAPVADYHRQGEMVLNTAAAAGAPSGWSCVAAGTPGTWKELAPVSL